MPLVSMWGGCHGALSGEGPVLAILAMLAQERGLRVAPGGSGPPIPSAALHGVLCPSGRRALEVVRSFSPPARIEQRAIIQGDERLNNLQTLQTFDY